MAKNPDQNGQATAAHKPASTSQRPRAVAPGVADHTAMPGKPPVRRGTVAKVSHTLSIALAERLEEFAFFQRVSESAVIEHSLSAFFAQSPDDEKLGEQLRQNGAGRRRKTN